MEEVFLATKPESTLKNHSSSVIIIQILEPVIQEEKDDIEQKKKVSFPKKTCSKSAK